MEKLVVKVQRIPGDEERAIVTDERRRYVLEVPASAPLRARMGKQQVAYFVANIMDAAVDILEPAPPQTW